AAADVRQALAARPGLAVVDPYVVPRRNKFMVGVLPEFQLHGLFFEDGEFAPVPVDVHDPATGLDLHLTVIGVLDDTGPLEMAGIPPSQPLLAHTPHPPPPP